MLLALLVTHPALAASPCPAPTVAAGLDPVDAAQAQVVGWINAGDAQALFGRFSGAMQAAVPLPAAEGFLGGLFAAGGCIATSERVSGSSGHAVYRLQASTHAWQLDLHVDPQGVVQGMSVTEPPPPDPPVARSTMPLRFPVDGAWTVFWGGDTADLNAHITHKSQRRAMDLLIFDAEGRSHTGDGTHLSDYYAYGKPVHAVAAGGVVTAIDGVPESVPGRLNPYMAVGNAVIIDHGGTFSVVAHLQPGTVKVKAGQRVKAGQLLGLCGNTGNSSEPHVHFQLMDGPSFEAAYGVEAVFSDVDVLRGGEPIPADGYAVRKGDVVTRVESSGAAAR